MSEFSDRPFAAGTVTGLRAFRTKDGGLAAVTRHHQWEPGENIGTCKPNAITPQYALTSEHRVADLRCRCGFYAYFGSDNDYGSENDYGWFSGEPKVTGIIQGYGLVTIGNRGFRAEKAKIIALIRPVPSEISDRYQVPVYNTVDDALAAHPTTQPEDVGIERRETTRWASGGVITASIYPGGYFVISSVAAAQFARTSLADALRKVGQSAREASANLVQATRAASATDAEPSPVERKQQKAQAAADARTRAGLRNSGGINRRQRRLGGRAA